MAATLPAEALRRAPARLSVPARSRDARRRRSACAALLLAALVLASGGCATYSERLQDARYAADRGAYPEALDRVNRLIGADSIEEAPDDWTGNHPLAVLERGVLLQAEGRYDLSARDLSEADSKIEIIDLSTDAIGKIGEYVYSGSSATYKASPTERLALNGLNMMNFLAQGDLSGAAVEARRFTNARDTLTSVGLDATGHFGAYLAGFVFERLGEGDRALRYYEEALAAGRLESLRAPVVRLARLNPYRGPRLEALLADSNGSSGTNVASAAPPSEILTVVALGRVPYKVPERVGIGAAVGIAGTYITGNPGILERSVLKVLVYPELKESGYRARNAQVRVDGAPASLEPVSAIGADIRREYQLIKPRIMGAAITRMITRALAAEGLRAAGNEAGGDAGPIVGLLAALFAEGSLVALDKPDTRSWTFLPDQVAISRRTVRPGDHEVEVRVDGVGVVRTVPVHVPEGGFGVVVVTVPR
ncbi:MAG: hypothetical protein R3F16_05995 [Myxococcota bacterium]